MAQAFQQGHGLVRRESLADAAQVQLHVRPAQIGRAMVRVEDQRRRTGQRFCGSDVGGIGDLRDTPRPPPQVNQWRGSHVERAAALAREPLRCIEDAKQIVADVNGPGARLPAERHQLAVIPVVAHDRVERRDACKRLVGRAARRRVACREEHDARLGAHLARRELVARRQCQMLNVKCRKEGGDEHRSAFSIQHSAFGIQVSFVRPGIGTGGTSIGPKSSAGGIRISDELSACSHATGWPV